MKRNLFWMLLVMIVLGSVVSFIVKPISSPNFYYAFNKKVFIKQVPNKVIIRYTTPPAPEQALNAINKNVTGARIKWRDTRTAIITTTTTAELNNLLRAGIEQDNVLTSNPVYTLATGEGGDMGITDEFAVKFLSSTSAKQIADLIKRTQVKIKWTVSDISVLTVPKGGDALAIANLYQESGLVEFAHPNFLEEITLNQAVIPNDEFFTRQFYLRNIGQTIADGHTGTVGADIKATEAWATTKGSSCVTIAVLDDGISPDHPDLPAARQIRLNGSNFGDGDPNDPSPRGFAAHGMHCAGIIAATQGNGEGISGVAPNCRIMPVRIFSTGGQGISGADVARAILFARNNGADIISNSWG